MLEWIKTQIIKEWREESDLPFNINYHVCFVYILKLGKVMLDGEIVEGNKYLNGREMYRVIVRASELK